VDNENISASLSLFRGQSREGIGEGPGHTIAQGEQYLAAEGELGDAALLAAVRPWLSFDSDPADHRTLGEQLEGWSCFCHAGRLFVVRLAAAGTFDRRAAYFAHGRAWKLEELPAGCDPGLHLGRSAAFDAPWQDGVRGERWEAPEPQLDTRALKAEPQVAARLLGHLFQALTGGYPVLYAVPAADFVVGGSMASLVAFSRAGLPANLRDRCCVRVYTRFPDLFLRHVAADLLVLPLEVAKTALGVARSAVLLNRQGEVIEGPCLDPQAQRYAEAVVERALALPAALPLFATRYGRQFGVAGLSDLAGVRGVQIVYNLAFALPAEAAVREQMVARYLPEAARTLGPGLRWRRLVGEDWGRLPAVALRGLLLGGLASSPGEQELWSEVAAEVGRQGQKIDAEVAAWWAASDPGRLDPLLALLGCDPPILSTACAMRCLGGVAAGELARRARRPEVFQALAEATSEGFLAAGWALDYVEEVPEDELPEAGELLVAQKNAWENWGDAPGLWLNRFLAAQPFSGDTSALLALGEALPSDAGLSALHGELDRRAVEALEETTAALLRAGWWFVWFRRRQTEVSDEEARRMALTWLGSPAWSEEGVEATREEWTLALKSLLSHGLPGVEVRGLCGGGEALRRWPRIPPFEQDQLLDAGCLCADFGGLAEIAAMARREGWVTEPEEPLFCGAGSVLREGLTETVLHWLRDPLPAELPTLDLQTSRILWQRAGHLQDRALQARVRAVAAWLKRDAMEALHAAVAPNLFGRQDFRNELAKWMSGLPISARLGDEGWQAIESRIGDGPPHQVTGISRDMARELMQRSWVKVAEFLVPGILAESQRDDLASQAIRAMLAGDRDAPCWGEMAKAEAALTHAVPGEAVEHPVTALARRLRESDLAGDEWDESIAARGWQTFLAAASHGKPRLLRSAQGVLPAFDLGLCLSPDGALGGVALQLVGSPAGHDYRGTPEWWQGLFHGLANAFRRDGQRSADDRVDVALTLLSRVAADLEILEKTAFDEALRAAENLPDRPSFSSLGAQTNERIGDFLP
jgi:hypothetical protein